MPIRVHENKRKEALDAIQKREAKEIHLCASQEGQEVGQEVHISQQEEEEGPLGPPIPYNEFSNDLEYMPSMDFAYAKALQLGCKERKEQFWHDKYNTATSSPNPPTENSGHLQER